MTGAQAARTLLDVSRIGELLDAAGLAPEDATVRLDAELFVSNPR